jgi:hypothetical protein
MEALAVDARGLPGPARSTHARLTEVFEAPPATTVNGHRAAGGGTAQPVHRRRAWSGRDPRRRRTGRDHLCEELVQPVCWRAWPGRGPRRPVTSAETAESGTSTAQSRVRRCRWWRRRVQAWRSMPAGWGRRRSGGRGTVAPWLPGVGVARAASGRRTGPRPCRTEMPPTAWHASGADPASWCDCRRASGRPRPGSCRARGADARPGHRRSGHRGLRSLGVVEACPPSGSPPASWLPPLRLAIVRQHVIVTTARRWTCGPGEPSAV